MIMRGLALAGLVLLLSAVPAWPGDGTAQKLEHVPKSCQQLYRWQERCRLGPCNVKRIEYWRERCKKDSTTKDLNPKDLNPDFKE